MSLIFGVHCLLVNLSGDRDIITGNTVRYDAK